MELKEALAVLPQYVIPQHVLSQMMSFLTHSENKLLKNLLIRLIIKQYGVNMAESLQEDINAFKSFNDFFTRELKPGIRTFTKDIKGVACPADGAISQAAPIANGNMIQAKGKSFTVTELLGGNAERAAPFNDGLFTTIYLAPKDYHRMHMPLTGTLKEMVHIPGCLFSVNTVTANHVDRLFARNERVAAIFDTEVGPMALVMVGAIFVSSVETVWHGVVTPPTLSEVRTWDYKDNAPVLAKGSEMGRFNMGSTIIVLFGKNKVRWEYDLAPEKVVRVGQKIGTLIG